MTNITHTVWSLLDHDASLKRDLSRGLINSRALARYLIKQYELDTTPDAVISAIRRYDSGHFDDVFQSAQKVIAQSKLSTKSKIANIALVKDTEMQKQLSKVFALIDYERGETIRVIQADESIKLIVDESKVGSVLKIFPKNKVLRVHRNLGEINMHLPIESDKTPGILSITSNELAMNGINVVETMSCVPEMIWFVNNDELLKAHEVLFGLCKG